MACKDWKRNRIVSLVRKHLVELMHLGNEQRLLLPCLNVGFGKGLIINLHLEVRKQSKMYKKEAVLDPHTGFNLLRFVAAFQKLIKLQCVFTRTPEDAIKLKAVNDGLGINLDNKSLCLREQLGLIDTMLKLLYTLDLTTIQRSRKHTKLFKLRYESDMALKILGSKHFKFQFEYECTLDDQVLYFIMPEKYLDVFNHQPLTPPMNVEMKEISATQMETVTHQFELNS